MHVFGSVVSRSLKGFRHSWETMEMASFYDKSVGGTEHSCGVGDMCSKLLCVPRECVLHQVIVCVALCQQPPSFGHLCSVNLVPMEITLKEVRKIRAGEDLTTYVVVSRWLLAEGCWVMHAHGALFW